MIILIMKYLIRYSMDSYKLSGWVVYKNGSIHMGRNKTIYPTIKFVIFNGRSLSNIVQIWLSWDSYIKHLHHTYTLISRNYLFVKIK